MSRVSTLLAEILHRHNLSRPDGRSLYNYHITHDELSQLSLSLKTLVPFIADKKSAILPAPAFVIWASEWLRIHFDGGILSWGNIFKGIGLEYSSEMYRWIPDLITEGLRYWQRKVRKDCNNHNEYIYTLLAECGLPDPALKKNGNYYRALSNFVTEIESEGLLGDEAALPIARRQLQNLPQVFHDESQAILLADLGKALINLRVKRRNSEHQDLPFSTYIQHLDQHEPTWRESLPLRLSQEALDNIISPIIESPSVRRSNTSEVMRQLRRDLRGNWHGITQIPDQFFLAKQLLQNVNPSLRLRLTARKGEAFLATPDQMGWLLRPSGGGVRGDVPLPIPPHEAVTLRVYQDGHLLQDVLLDPARPPPQ